MISGYTSEKSRLGGTITAQKALSGTISGIEPLSGKLSVSVREVPYYETTNIFGGTTVYIGKEIADHG